MNLKEVEDKVVSILRSSALLGSDRTVPLKEPLKDLGLGLDSLAVVEFVVALEKEFQIQIPDSIWDEGGKLTLDFFVNLIMNSKRNSVFLLQEYRPSPPSQALNENLERGTRNTTREPSFLNGLLHRVSQLFRRSSIFVALFYSIDWFQDLELILTEAFISNVFFG